jgi:hypothetical protein
VNLKGVTFPIGRMFSGLHGTNLHHRFVHLSYKNEWASPLEPELAVGGGVALPLGEGKDQVSRQELLR